MSLDSYGSSSFYLCILCLCSKLVYFGSATLALSLCNSQGFLFFAYLTSLLLSICCMNPPCRSNQFQTVSLVLSGSQNDIHKLTKPPRRQVKTDNLHLSHTPTQNSPLTSRVSQFKFVGVSFICEYRPANEKTHT